MNNSMQLTPLHICDALLKNPLLLCIIFHLAFQFKCCFSAMQSRLSMNFI